MRLVERELPPSIIQGAEDGRTTVLIANGANRDDVGDHRPGMQAATEHKIASPLLELGMTKQDVRNLAKAIGLNVWSKPAAPCLASRVPYHTEVTPHKLNQIEKAEDCLYALGFRDFRVRHHEVIARIELQISDMHRSIEPEIREQIVRELRQIGYHFIALDLAGFKSGNLNHTIVDEVSHYSSSK